MSSFDNKFAFDAELAQAKKSNSSNINSAFEARMRKELQEAADRFGDKSPQYIQLQRGIVAFARIYDTKKHNLDVALDTLHEESIKVISQEIARLKDDTGVKSEYRENGLNFKTVARKINVNSSIQEFIGDIKIDFHNLTPDERQKLESKKFSLSSKQSWQETGLLLGEEFANSIKDIALFFGSIPGSLVVIPEYISLRKDRNSKLKNEATLALMLEEFPALALLDLVTDWDKGAIMLKEIGTKLVSGTQGDIAFTITSLIGLLAGGSGVAGKVSGIAGKLARAGEKALKKTAVTVGKTGGKLAKGAATITVAGSTALGGVAYAGEVAAVAGAKIARVGGAVDTLVSGEFVVTGAAKGAAKLTQGGKIIGLDVPKGLKNTGMTPEKYNEMVATNAKLSPEARVAETAKTLGLNSLSDTQKIALEKAHNTGTSGAGEWTQGELRAKMEILHREGGFSKEQTRAIMEHGLAGIGVRGLIQKTKDWFIDMWNRLFRKEKNTREPSVHTTETAHGAPLEPAGPNVIRVENGGETPNIKPPVVENKTIESPELTNKPTKLEGADIKEKPPYRNESRLAKLHQGRSDSETLLQKLQAEYARLRDAFHIPSDKQLKFDYFHTSETNGNRINSQMRVVKVGEDMFVQVKNNGVWEVATEQNIIPKSPNARAEYDAYVQHQKDLLRSGVHNQFMKPEELNKQISDATNRLQRIDSLIQKESTRPMRPIQNNDTGTESRPNTSIGQQRTLSHSDTIDPHAKSRIETEHGLDGSRPRMTQADLLGGSFRSEIDAMMKMDDATFQKNFTEVQYRKGKEGNRPHEAEMYEAAAKVRKISDADIIANADDIIKGNRKFMGSRHPNHGPSDITLSDKAIMVAENAALRSRLKDIIGKEINQTIPGGINALDDDLAKGRLDAIRNKISKFDKIWLALLLLLLPFMLPSCDPEKVKNPPDDGGGSALPNIPSTPTIPHDVTPDEVVNVCVECLRGEQSTIDQTRTINGRTADKKYREGVTSRWMQSKEWKSFVKDYENNKDVLSGLSNAAQRSVVTSLENILANGGATIENVQQLQRCIGLYAKAPRSGVTKRTSVLIDDNKNSQDGMLGPITTNALKGFVDECTPHNLPNSTDPVAATTAPSSTDEDNSGYTDPMGNGGQSA